MKTKEQYETALKSHSNKYSKSTALQNGSSEFAYRDSAKKLRKAYDEDAKEMMAAGTPIAVWM